MITWNDLISRLHGDVREVAYYAKQEEFDYLKIHAPKKGMTYSPQFIGYGDLTGFVFVYLTSGGCIETPPKYDLETLTSTY